MSRQGAEDQGRGPEEQMIPLSGEPTSEKASLAGSEIAVGEPESISSQVNNPPETAERSLGDVADGTSNAGPTDLARKIFDACKPAFEAPDNAEAREQALLQIESILEQYVTVRTDAALELRTAEHEKEEQALRRMMKASADMIEAIPSGLLLYQYQPPGELFFLNCNAEARRLTGVEVDDCRGVEFDEIWPNARSQGLTEALLRTASTGEPFETSRAYFRKGKIERFFRARAFVLPGNRLGLAFEDNSEGRLAEETLRKSEEQLTSRVEKRTAELFRENCVLQEEISRLGQVEEMAFGAGRSAALQEMAGRATRSLSPIVRALEESARRASTRLESGYLSLVKPSVQEILDASLQIKEIVKRLRQFSRASPEGAALERKVFDLSDAVREGLELVQGNGLQGELGAGGAGRHWDLLLDPACYVRGEPSEMVDVVVILVKNALDSAPDPEPITIQTRVEDDTVVLLVGDRGAGISDVSLGQVFEPFGTSKPAHAGLGLAAAAGVVRRLGGTVHVAAAEGEGATFTVRLPRTDMQE